MMTILSGKCRLIDHATGEVITLEPSDTYFTRDGSQLVPTNAKCFKRPASHPRRLPYQSSQKNLRPTWIGWMLHLQKMSQHLLINNGV